VYARRGVATISAAELDDAVRQTQASS
jgi:hypothetical protein